MGSFVFKWDHPAEEVYVTGTFDDWQKSEKLVKDGGVFSKDVTLKSADEKIYYKFVVDGQWVTDHTAPIENDASGNPNNFLTPERIVKHTPATAGIMSSAGPTSTTAGLAGQVPLEEKSAPLEKTGSSDLPGSFPETPGLETGDFSVNPLPATDGAANPIKLAPGEKVPHPATFTGNTLTSGVHDDPELVAADKAKGGSYDASPFVQSAGATSTTAALAGAVPLESSKVPEVVKESQEKAGFEPEASAIPEEVKEKSEVEKELLKEVPEAPSTSEGTAGKETPDKTEKTGVTAGEAAAAVGGAAVAIGGAAVAFASGAASKLPESVTSKLPLSIQNSLNGVNGHKSVEPAELAKDTPAVVKESIAESGKAPEAAANEEAVLEKKAVEQELLKEVKTENSTGESAPKITAAAPTATEPKSVVEPKSATLAAPATPVKPAESRDVSPGTVPGSRTAAPAATTGIESKTVDPVTPATPATPATPSSSKAPVTGGSSPAPTGTAEKKKKNRLSSFFGKLKGKSDKK